MFYFSGLPEDLEYGNSMTRDDVLTKGAQQKADAAMGKKMKHDGQGKLERVDFIKKKPNSREYGVYSESGKLLGSHPTHEAAGKQLAAIEASKARQDDLTRKPATSPSEDDKVKVAEW